MANGTLDEAVKKRKAADALNDQADDSSTADDGLGDEELVQETQEPTGGDQGPQTNYTFNPVTAAPSATPSATPLPTPGQFEPVTQQVVGTNQPAPETPREQYFLNPATGNYEPIKQPVAETQAPQWSPQAAALQQAGQYVGGSTVLTPESAQDVGLFTPGGYVNPNVGVQGPEVRRAELVNTPAERAAQQQAYQYAGVGQPSPTELQPVVRPGQLVRQWYGEGEQGVDVTPTAPAVKPALALPPKVERAQPVPGQNYIFVPVGGQPPVPPPAQPPTQPAPPAQQPTQRYIPYEMVKGSVVIPTVVDGRQLSDPEAIERFNQTGESVGPLFKTPAEAARYAAQQSQQTQPPVQRPGVVAPTVAPTDIKPLTALEAQEPNIDIQSSGYTPGRTQPIRNVVLHSTDGTIKSDIPTLTTSGNVGVQYYVTKDGRIMHFVSDADSAWQAGKDRYGNNANPYTIGIEQEHIDGKEAWPDAQVRATAKVAAGILLRNPNLTLDDVVGHSDIAPERKKDPVGYPWDHFRAYVSAYLGQGAPHAVEVHPSTVPAANTQQGYGAISGQEQMERPAHYTGTITVGNQSFDYGTGGGSTPSLPYGRYYLTDTVGPVGQRIGALFGISDSPHSGNTVNDPATGSAREGVEIHPDVSGHLASNGCIAVDASQFPDFAAAVRNLQAQGQELALQVNPDGSASIIPVGSEAAAAPGRVAQAEPITKQVNGFYQNEDPRSFVTGRASTFATPEDRALWLATNGEQGDSGRGAPRLGGLDTTQAIGVAVPEDVLQSQLGNSPAAWRKARVDIIDPASGRRMRVPIVEIGPGNPNVLVDMTPGLSRLFGGDRNVAVKLVSNAGPDVTKDPGSFADEQAALREGFDSSTIAQRGGLAGVRQNYTFKPLETQPGPVTEKPPGGNVVTNFGAGFQRGASTGNLGAYQAELDNLENHPERSDFEQQFAKLKSDILTNGYLSDEQKKSALDSLESAHAQQLETFKNQLRQNIATEQARLKALPSDTGVAGKVGEFAAGAIPTVAGQIALGPAGAVLGGAAVGGAQAYAQTRDELIKSGKSPQEAADTADKVAGIAAASAGALSAVGIKLPIANWAARLAAGTLTVGAINYAVTAGSQMLQNQVAGRPLMQGVSGAANEQTAIAMLLHVFPELGQRILSDKQPPVREQPPVTEQPLVSEQLPSAPAPRPVTRGEILGPDVPDASYPWYKPGPIITRAAERTAFSPEELAQAVDGLAQKGWSPEQLQKIVENLQPEPDWNQQQVFMRAQQEDEIRRAQAIQGLGAQPEQPPPAPRAEIDPSRVTQRVAGDQVHWLSTNEVNQRWNNPSQQNFFIPPGGTENTIGERYPNAMAHVQSDAPIHALEATVHPDGTIEFTDGRHRFAAMRDLGIDRVPVALDAESVKNAQASGLKDQPPAPVGESEPWVSKIANRFTAERIIQGELGQVAPGQGVTREEMMAKGLAMGPEQINQHVSDLMHDIGDPREQAAAVRAEEARLSKVSRDASFAYESNPNPQTKFAADNAFKDVTDFHNGPVAKLKNNWHAQGMTLQGELPMDLSTMNGLREEFLKNVGEAPPPEMEPTLRKTAQAVRDRSRAEVAAMKKLGAEIEKQTAGRRLPTDEQVRENIMKRMKVEPCSI